MGDFPGLTAKLDYLRDLGVTAIWLLPFNPSPWKDDGYDISDYLAIHPAYGTLKDFQVCLREAHNRGLKVITELVLNHTSDQHEWFQRSRRAAPGSHWRDYYVWSDTPDKYPGARIIFQDFEASNWTWDPVAKAYFWHRFYSYQPDLNFDNPNVRRALLKVLDFWAGMGVDGFRLDAVPYLFEREGTNCENLPETHAFLKEMRAHMDANFPGRMLLSEANMWPEDAVHYMGNGDECNMSFHFPLMPRLFMATRLEDRYPIIEIMKQTPAIPENAQWALFLRNHDELTLEMVTDEERDYMYRAYAGDRAARINLGIRRRLAPLLSDNRRKIELLNALLFSMPGTPVLYYGDEIGMGDNFYLGDRNGVRTPMQWSSDRNAGFSRANPQRLYLPVVIDPEYHYEARNVEAQQANPNSLLWWCKRLIRLRKEHRAFGRGTLEFLSPDNRRVLAFYRKFEDEHILVVANLSRFPQPAAIDLSEYEGYTPVEMFGGTDFPKVGNQPYLFTLGPNAFYWFSLVKPVEEAVNVSRDVPKFHAKRWEDLILDPALPGFLATRSWFLARDRRIRQMSMVETVPVEKDVSCIVLARVEFGDGEPETYSFALSRKSEGIEQGGDEVGSGLADRAFCGQLLEAIARRRKYAGEHGEILAHHTKPFRSIWGARHPNLEPALVESGQRNSTVVYGDRFILKFFRRVEEGVHPEVELGRYFTEEVKTASVAKLAGYLEYRAPGREPMVLAALHGYVAHEGTAASLTQDHLKRFHEEAQLSSRDETLLEEKRHPMELAGTEAPVGVRALMGEYLDRMELLGRRTGELHIELARGPFAPEPFSEFYRRSLFHSMSAVASRVLTGAEDEELLASIRAVFSKIEEAGIGAQRIRIHGDLDLTKVLDTGKDFCFIDFEGNPAIHLSERRIKRSSLRDVAQMLLALSEAAGEMSAWSELWFRWTAAAYLRGYFAAVKGHGFLPEIAAALRAMLNIYVLNEAVEKVRLGSGGVAIRWVAGVFA
jgi:maltose alpha-D-glucosyltransferase/alpha-amylase